MSEFQLGQRVKYSERLVRVNIQTYAGYTAPRSEELLQEALDLMGISRTRGGTTFKDLDWRLWVPETFAREHLHSGLVMLKYSSVHPAGEGVIVQRATLQQGGTYFNGSDEPSCWMDHGTTRAYKVAFDINRTPVHVLPQHITEVAS
jgi:hypothetical protein